MKKSWNGHLRIAGVICVLCTILAYKWAMGWSEPKLLQNPDLQGTGITESTEMTVSEEEKIEAAPTNFVMDKKIPWSAPNYSGQEGALGWSPDAFNVPAGMEERVQFWVKIYTQYTTHQGILHDSEHVSIVYDKVDFNSIENDNSLTDRQKRKAKKDLVENKKKEIRTRLANLEKVTDPTALTGEDLRLWNLFNLIDEKNKFKEAAHRKRLRFQLGQSDRFLQGIYYSGRYLKEMERIFKEKGLPIELTRLPFVESSFNVNARSRVGASGIWQFMRYTGRRFMRINFAVDERNDPLRATHAAARLFRMNYDMLGLWPLAVTGYNHGPAGVLRVTKKFATTNIADLVNERYRRFGFASANFYASFLAAVEVEKKAKHYFGENVFWDQPIDAREIQLARNISRKILINWFEGNTEKAQALNPHLSRAFWQGHTSVGQKDFVRVPSAKYEVAMSDLKSLPTAATRDTASGSELNYYLIGQGETLSDIASQMGVSVSLITELNGIDNPRRIRAGQKIILPPSKK